MTSHAWRSKIPEHSACMYQVPEIVEPGGRRAEDRPVDAFDSHCSALEMRQDAKSRGGGNHLFD